jgi:tetratricopeptide (TPR) repeat protein
MTLRTLAFMTAFAAAAVPLGGCSGSLSSFIVNTRNHQGDVALKSRNLVDASIAYRLALRLSPDDAHARAGLADVQLQVAAQDYSLSKFDAALAALAIAAKYQPDSVRLAQLRTEIEQARIKRAIVLSNYPINGETGLALRRAYAALRKESNAIVATLQRFDYTYDSNELVKAIRASNRFNAEVARLTTRLVNYRQLVESGAPERPGDVPLAPAASLLPLP